MARGITEDEVWKACDVLLLEGARPTIERVRQKLGRGSPNTVSPMLETWFKHLGARIKDPGAFSAPASMPDPVQQAGQHLWEVAQTEARRDLDNLLKEGLAAATANVEAEKERVAIADAAAFSAASKAFHLQAELEQRRAALESERSLHAATAAKLDTAGQRCSQLQAELIQARQAIDEARFRADASIAAADTRASGAERRASMEIERERVQRTKAEKAVESITQRFEDALRAQVSATEQLEVLEGRLARYKADASRREQEMHAEIARRESRLQELNAALAEVKLELSGRAAQDTLMSQLLAKLSPDKTPTADAVRPTKQRAARSRRPGG